MAQLDTYTGPLAGLQVIDFGWYYAGSMAGMLLADQGATVLRVVRPGERELPEEQFRLLNRNKKLVELDLKSEEGRAKALSLIARADVLIENFRPGVMKRLGLDYASVKGVNPGLVYLSLPGFASTDKERVSLQAWEGLLGAASCSYTQLHLFREALGFPPLYTPVPHASTYGAIHGVTAVMAALVAREEQGVGTVIEVPLVNAAAHAVALTFAGVDAIAFPPPAGEMNWSATDSEEEQLGKLDKAARNMGLASKTYHCSDGREIYISIYLTNTFIEKLMKALGLYKQALKEGFVCVGPWEAGLDNDLGNTGTLSPERAGQLKNMIADALAKQPAAYWEDTLAGFGIPAMLIRTREEYMALEPMKEAGVLETMGDLTVAGRLGDVSGPDGSVIAEGYREAEAISAEEADALFTEPARQVPQGTGTSLSKGELLKGVKVVDFCNVIAGPTSSHVLAEFGAEVIKADAPETVHPMFIGTALELNQGKRSLLSDIRTAPGRDIFNRLIGWADLVVHNILDNKARRMGVAQPQLEAINPKIVSCQLTALGGPNRGVWETRPGFDNLVQGFTGLLAEYGTLECPQWHGAITAADTLGGVSMAFISLVGLYRQRITGQGAEARTSLVRVTNHYQLPLVLQKDGKPVWSRATGQFATGEGLLQRLYHCADGWIYVGATEEKAAELVTLVTGQSSVEEAALEAGFAEQSCAHWLSQFKKAGIAAHKVINTKELLAAATTEAVSNEPATETVHDHLTLLCWEDHPCGKPVTKLSLECSLVGEGQTWTRLKPAPRYGEHTEEVLQDLGYSQTEVQDLLHLKAAYTHIPAIGNAEDYFFTPKQDS